MTAKEKAHELYEKYFYLIPSISDEGQTEHNITKNCSLFHVNEMLYFLKDTNQDKEINFYKEVKTELEQI